MKNALIKLLNSSNFHSLAGNSSFAFFNAATFLILARSLDKDLFGQWLIYVTASSLLNMLRLGLTGTGAIRAISLAEGKDKQSYTGASYQLGFYTFAATAVLFYPSYFILVNYFSESYYYSVLLFYPLLSLVNLPYNQAIVISQAKMNFYRGLVLKAIHGTAMFSLIGMYVLFFEVKLGILILLHATSNLIPGLVSLIRGWDGFRYFSCATKAHTRELLNFGKYSTLISVGSSLLRSADTFILSMSAAMGAPAIAIYAIPMKFVEAVEIPLRSFTATAYPKLSQALATSKEKFNSILHSYNVATTIMILPMLLILLLFAEPLLGFVGGSQYQDSVLLQKKLLYIVLLYILLLPADRYTGVALFALDKPVKNFHKTMIMLAANVIFDLIAVFVFKSLIAVAFATLIFTLLGVYWGWFFVKKESGIKLSAMLIEGMSIVLQVRKLIAKKATTDL